MLILIAESKTMTTCRRKVTASDYKAHTPLTEKEADGLMESLRDMTVDELAAAVKISGRMAVNLKKMIYDFPDKEAGDNALRAFNGVVFKAFDSGTLSVPSLAAAGCRVRIISSLYGWLRPDDIIKPYRFDFTTPLAPDNKTFAAFWKERVTSLLLHTLSELECHDVLNLLPADAARCIDWRVVEQTADVWKADFRIIDGETLRTPHAGRLKTLRGLLLRHMIEHDITSPDLLKTIEGPDYIADGTSSDSHTILFKTV